MKKILLPCLVSLAFLFTQSSCKKDWVCTCSGTPTALGASIPPTNNVPVSNMTHADAEKTCDELYCASYYNWQSTGYLTNVSSSVH